MITEEVFIGLWMSWHTLGKCFVEDFFEAQTDVAGGQWNVSEASSDTEQKIPVTAEVDEAEASSGVISAWSEKDIAKLFADDA